MQGWNDNRILWRNTESGGGSTVLRLLECPRLSTPTLRGISIHGQQGELFQLLEENQGFMLL